ncbi:MAG: hypothetical protein AB2L24_00075 [Mangrovibacterium sp.]
MILEIPWFIYNYYGDIQVLSRSYEPMKRYVDYLGTTAVDSVFLDWWLGDWLEVDVVGGRSKTDADYPDLPRPVISIMPGLFSKIAKILGNEADSNKYNQLSEKIKQAYNKRFLNQTTGLYAEDSQTSQVVPLYLGLAQDDKRELITKGLLDNIKKKERTFKQWLCGLFIPVVRVNRSGLWRSCL